MHLVNTNAPNIEQLRRTAEGYGEILEALADRDPNSRADLIARHVEGMGQEWLDAEFTDGTDWMRDDYLAQIRGMGSIFRWLYLRLIGQDKKLPANDAWVMHTDQRGAVPLHPTKVMPFLIESRFVDPVTGDTFTITIEREDREPCCEGAGE